MCRAALGACVLLLLTAPARAQEAPPPEGYRTLISQALEEFDGRRWAEARALFRRAHALEPNARTLRGIGMASFELREYAAALEAFEAALLSTARPLTDAQQAHVRGLQARAEAFVGRYRLDLIPSGAVLDVDGLRVTPSASLVLDLGRHTLRATAPDHMPWIRVLQVDGGERESVEVRLVPVPAPPPPEAPSVSAAPAVPSPITPAAPASSSADPIGPALLVAGGATLVVSALPIAWWVDRESNVAACRERPCSNVGVIESQRDAAAVLSFSALGVSAALGILGVVLWLTQGSDETQACVPWSTGFGCRF